MNWRNKLERKSSEEKKISIRNERQKLELENQLGKKIKESI